MSDTRLEVGPLRGKQATGKACFDAFGISHSIFQFLQNDMKNEMVKF